MKQKLKNWLIRKLGGYTYGEVHWLVTDYCTEELRNSVYIQNLDTQRFVEAGDKVRQQLDNKVHLFFVRVMGYRGNTPRKPF